MSIRNALFVHRSTSDPRPDSNIGQHPEFADGDHRVVAVNKVIHRLQEDLSGAHSLAELSHTACLSPFHFHRVFKKITASTPARFLAALRIAEAKYLLLHTELKVTSICMQVGYSSLGTFTTQFTRLVGVSPRNFRRLAGQLADQSFCNVLAAAVPTRRARPAPMAPNGCLSIRLHGLTAGWSALVGLFESGIPQGWPAACALVHDTDEVELAVNAGSDGSFVVLVMTFSPDVDTAAAMAGPLGDDCMVGSSGPIQIAAGQPAGDRIAISMRPRCASDPPILFAAPMIAAQENLVQSVQKM